MLISKLLYKLYAIRSRIIRDFIVSTLNRLEGGAVHSVTFRKIFKTYHHVEIGMYSMGGCFRRGNIAPGTTIGRYCSFARNVTVLNRNHPLDFKSTHALFFNPALKLCDHYVVEDTPLKIGNDVWMGEYAVILAHVTEIGDGAVIGAGTIVNKNVPPYAVVIGNPGRVVRYRFSKETIDELLASRWWEKDLEQVKQNIEEFQQPYERLSSDRRSHIEAKGETDQAIQPCLSKEAGGHE